MEEKPIDREEYIQSVLTLTARHRERRERSAVRTGYWPPNCMRAGCPSPLLRTPSCWRCRAGKSDPPVLHLLPPSVPWPTSHPSSKKYSSHVSTPNTTDISVTKFNVSFRPPTPADLLAKTTSLSSKNHALGGTMENQTARLNGVDDIV
jgi:hypothetical protein